ncbi:LysR family transcriptional regulator [Parahaliea maris]|uniref:LysR family transcriptional regulator n=1 Tax=Parahaliea maris TaxID=2716870 RepID=A0A5C9A764_9GAMM|nr:substrate-binding domain-containing protein [Parahaliea maris]TXS96516.1 LysR family transcriptional regulator [Parahaliea maris]
MRHLQLSPAWFFTDGSGSQLDPKLFALLRALHRDGKLTDAARDCGLSYRHAWNLLQQWGDFFQTPLVEKRRGRGTLLSPLGHKLLWAEQRVAARLEPQLESLSLEINGEIEQLLEGAKPALRLHASHGYAVALLPRFCRDLQLDLQYCSPHDALAALERNACDVAGFHLPLGVGDDVARKILRKLRPRSHRVIQFITRRQGLMVQAGNPSEIRQLADLAGRGLRFINREPTSGTRALLNVLLQEAQVRSRDIAGFEQEEFTHSAIAAYIAAGMADAGFGVEAAARQFGLDFIPLAQEHYLMACHRKSLGHPGIHGLLSLLRGDDFHAAVEDLPGYSARYCGKVMTVDELQKHIYTPDQAL